MIIPILLAGGAGTRLWPLSRQSFPKQFTQLVGDESLFQACARRFQRAGFAPPTVMTHGDFRFIVAEQLDGLGLHGARILIEPDRRNTAPAILAAALAHQDTPDAVLVVAPSDHRILDMGAFHSALDAGVAAAQGGALVSFGVRPTRAETGYGYLHLADGADGLAPVKAFVEKPDAAQAQAMVQDGAYLWNAGLFAFRVDVILAAFRQHAPALMGPVTQAVDQATPDLGFTRLAPGPWGGCEDISVDYAVMERAGGLQAVALDCGWSDMGSWQAVQDAGPADSAGNVTSGNASALGCTNTQLRSEVPGLAVVGAGLDGITVVATPDAVLVTRTDDSAAVKQAVTDLSARGLPQATEFHRSHRPWGYFETLSLGARFQVKRIMVHPGASLSLQSHVHRAEHWVVVEGSAMVTVGDEVNLVSENQSAYIPLGAVHRLYNPGKVALHLIEVQSGAYLGEDDITRYEDNYARVLAAE